MSIFAAIQNHPDILSVFFDVSGAAIMVQADSSYNITGCNEKMSRTDVLTGLANRRHFQERYEELFVMVRRHGCILSVLLLDLDFFKQVNDSLGHDAGDAVLSEFGRVLRENCRQDDFPARFGGEEFIVLLPHTPAAEAMVLGERLREIVAGRDMLPDRQRVTISAGIAELEPEESKESLIQRADQALYRAKHQGRNRCAAAD